MKKTIDWDKERRWMVETQLKRRGIMDKRVLEAMGRVPRHEFVPSQLQESAYQDGPLSIGEGQTISQPYMVALMTECLQLTGKEKVLEIGTGSGYQTAILTELAQEVYSIERLPALARRAKEDLERQGYTNFQIRIADGTKGWPELALFDAIIVTAGAPEVPQTLIDQLKEGGRLVIPVGSRYSQALYRITKKEDRCQKEEFTLCIFVPLLGEYGWKDN